MAVIDVSALARSLHGFVEQLDKQASLALREAVDAAERHAVHTTLFRDGDPTRRRRGKHLRDSIESRAEWSRGWVRATSRHARFVEDGTRAHRIIGKTKPLRFKVAGSWVSTWWVEHPGTKARPFVRQARDHGEQVFEREIAGRLSRLVK